MSKRFGRNKKRKLLAEIESTKQKFESDNRRSFDQINDLRFEIDRLHANSTHRSESIRLSLLPDNYSRETYSSSHVCVEVALNIKPIIMRCNLSKSDLLRIKSSPIVFAHDVSLKIKDELIIELPKMLKGLV